MRYSSLLKSSVLLAGLSSRLVAADETEAPSDVKVLTSETFEAFADGEGLKLIEFYAPWCGHCKQLAPQYEEAATALKEKDILLAKVDCVDQADLCASHGVTGYPTLKVFKNGSDSPYSGPRKADGIISYMVKRSLPAVSQFTAAEHEEIKGKDKIVVLAYVPEGDEALTEHFNAAAELHRDDYLFGITSDEAAIKAAGVTAPAIVLYKKFDEGRNDLTEVEGVSATSIISFIKENAVPLMDEVSGENYGTYSASGLPLAYLFVDPTDAAAREAIVNELSPIAKKHKGKINFVWIDAVKFVEHGKNLGLKEGAWPAFVMQELDTHRKFPLEQSAEVSFAAIDKLVDSYVAGTLQPTLKSQPIPEEQTEKFTTVVGKSFEDIVYDDDKDVFIQFSAPWCGHCKRLAPTWEQFAEQVATTEGLVIAKMDATENDLPLSVPFSIEGFPTLKFKKAGTKEFVDYDGARELEDLIAFTKKHSTKNVVVVVPEPEAEVEEEVVEQKEEAQKPVEKKEDGHDEL